MNGYGVVELNHKKMKDTVTQLELNFDDEQKVKVMKNTVNIFLSYSHKNRQYIHDFQTHISPIKETYSLNIFCDSQINTGEEFNSKIDDELDKSDIVLLFVSAHFLASPECKKEKKQSLELRNKRNIVVVPIILSTCQWQETELKDLLATPEDGKPIDNFEDKNQAWNDVIESLKNHIGQVKRINEIQIKAEFKKILQDTELLTKTYPSKEKVLLDDIFVGPRLQCYDETREKEFEEDIEYSKLEENILEYKNIAITGENQSGKTVLCKKLFLTLRKKGLLPVYVSSKDEKMPGIITNRIRNSFKEQYAISQETKYETLEQRVIPIVDDFHLAKRKETHINNLLKYSFSILVLDDIFDLDIANKNLVRKFKHFKIKEFSPSLRDTLIRKWFSLKDNTSNTENYQELDEKTEQVDATLGKIIGKGIVPSYPFFIVTILSTYETANPLDENITSQGHCYQALIYIALRKKIPNKDIDTYLNFLTMIAYEFFNSKKRDFIENEIKEFINNYKTQYNLPGSIEKDLLSNLQEVNILVKNSFNSISFVREYLYYYFVAKYIAENINHNKAIVDKIMNNLHKNENAYIAIFIVHHSKTDYVLDEILLNSLCLFDGYEPINLKKDEVSFLDDKANYIAEATLPQTDETTEYHRKRELETRDKIEESQRDEEDSDTENEHDNLYREIRRSIKTVEVMGSILKNRSGSLKKERLKELFREGMNVHFRLLKSFLKLIEGDANQQLIIDWINSRLQKITEKEIEQDRDKLEERSKIIFWNLNFIIFYSYINKIVHSLGSDNLISITNEVCEEIDTPASFLVKHGILMWYYKNLQIDKIAKEIQEKTFSDTAERLIKYMIIDHCSMHNIKSKDRQKLESKLKLLQASLKTNKQ